MSECCIDISDGYGIGDTARDQTILWKALHLMCTVSSRIMHPNQDGTPSEDLKQVIQLLREESSGQQTQHNQMHHHSTTGDLDTSQVENLLIDGKRREAISQAESTGHWGVALLVARSMGEAVWAETVARLASQFDQDSPLCNFIQVQITVLVN